jgi:hypothetical protein
VPPREDPSAALAARYIAATLGVQVDVWDTCGRQGAYDLRYEQQGRVVAVEAKSVVDYDFRLMGARIARSPYVPCQRLGRLWVVDLRHGGDVRLARDGLPDVLEQLEARGWHDQHAYRLARWAGLADELDRLAVTGCGASRRQRGSSGLRAAPGALGCWEGAIHPGPGHVRQRSPRR